jgi:hypothetical protein
MDEQLTKKYGSIQQAVSEVRDSPDKAFAVNRTVATTVIDWINKHGAFCHDGNRQFIFSKHDCELIPIEGGNLQLKLMLSKAGVNAVEMLYDFVVEELKMYCLQHGRRTTVRSFAHYDRLTNRLYVACGNSMMYRLSADSVIHCCNGDDGVLFCSSGVPEYDLSARHPGGPSPLDALLDAIPFEDNQLSAGECRRMFKTWLLGLFFPELQRTRVILALIGEAGSGKSTTLKKVGRILFGPSFNVCTVPTKEDSFNAMASNSHFVALDNADSPKEWLNDALAVAATGASVARRKLYSDNELVDFAYRAFLALTSRTPSFTRDDVADRLLVFNLGRFGEFTSESRMMDDIEKTRGSVMTDIFEELRKVLAALNVTRDRQYSSKFRVADFADFALRIADHSGELSLMQDMLSRVGKQQQQFAAASDIFSELLSMWLETEKNSGRRVLARDLASALNALAISNGIKTKPMDSYSLGQHLSSRKSHFEKNFGMRFEDKGSRNRFYRFGTASDEERNAA